ncbi:MAG: acyl-ACP--UDP-N-acetylglucosamine O-acyltransferase [Aestuariivita sp.]|nr:acyl-ACP--UDP-N-acetylglucosamine O-acyltransferase [Aestuariivita sp.]
MTSEIFIHPQAIVEAGAELGEGCTIGPFCVVGSNVKVGNRVTLKSHVVLAGNTSIGDDTIIFPFAVIGEISQDKKYKGEKTFLRIGARNNIREHVTMHTGTRGGGGLTQIGSDGLFMAGCHIAHDATVGNHAIIANSAAIAGHCILEDNVIVGGLCGIHQRVRIGKGAIIGALTMVTHDVIPYCLVQGTRGKVRGLNYVGLKRRGVSRYEISNLTAVFEELMKGEGTFHERAEKLNERENSAYVKDMVQFILGDSSRAFLKSG